MYNFGFFSNSIEIWKKWWQGLSSVRRMAPLILLILYWGLLSSLNGLRDDLVVCSLLPVILFYLGPSVRPFYQFLLPLFLVSILYDSQRYFADTIRGPIHVTEPYEFDKTFFGVKTEAGILTPNEWWQKHTHPLLDFFTGLAYIIFIPVYIFVAGLFRFWFSRVGTKFAHPRSLLLRSPQIMWGFLWVNLLGWSTYYWYAASPPWYVELYGFGPARTDVLANLAGCARFDQLIGMPFFENWYGRSADVHGAIPSLHIAYPLMSVYYAFRFGALRLFTTAFFLLMCFSAVYLNHHYILDILWGSAYALLVSFALDMYWNWNFKRKNITVPGESSDMGSRFPKPVPLQPNQIPLS